MSRHPYGRQRACCLRTLQTTSGCRLTTTELTISLGSCLYQALSRAFDSPSANVNPFRAHSRPALGGLARQLVRASVSFTTLARSMQWPKHVIHKSRLPVPLRAQASMSSNCEALSFLHTSPAPPCTPRGSCWHSPLKQRVGTPGSQFTVTPFNTLPIPIRPSSGRFCVPPSS